jgi:hypothetical protein
LLGREVLAKEQIGHIRCFGAEIGKPNMLDRPIASRGIRGGILMLGEELD